MKWRISTPVKISGLVVLVLALVGITAAAMPYVKEWIKPNHKESGTSEQSTNSVALDEKQANTLRFVIPETNKALGIQTGKVREAQPRWLELNGSLGPDTDRLLPVRSRFPGEVMDIGIIRDDNDTLRTQFRDVGNGDVAHKGELLAVVWSKDLGMTKSSLVDALSKLRLDQETLARYEELYRQGAQSDRNVREQERNVESDRIAVRTAELTLRSWRLTEDEIKQLYDEATELTKSNLSSKSDYIKKRWEEWARVEVRAPFDGTILEKNVARGAIVDTTTNLFIIGDLSHLTVWANVYEEDLPMLQALRGDTPKRSIPWEITLKVDSAAKPLKGTVSEIRPIIDPTQHTALVKGRVENPEGRLLSGQFITARVEIPAAKDEVEIPTTALIEDGQESVIFVAPNEYEARYRMRHVTVVRRGNDWVSIRVGDPKNDKASPLQTGDLVVTAGALELRAALRDLQDTKASEKK